RVELAFTFVTYMGHRIQPLVAVDNMGVIQSEPKPELSNAERGAFDAACTLLTDYFTGSMDLEHLELQRQAANNFELTKRCPGLVIPCPECLGRRENGVG